FFAVIAATAQGQTMLHDWVYEHRAIYLTELTKLGANVKLMDPHRVLIEGPTRWSGTELVCPPALHPAVVTLLAMLAAKGTSVLRNVYVINRGYEDLAERLNKLGARIETFRDIWAGHRRPFTRRPLPAAGDAVVRTVVGSGRGWGRVG